MWEKSEYSETTWIFNSSLVPIGIHLGRWLNSGPQWNEWTAVIDGKRHFWQGDMSVEQVKKEALCLFLKMLEEEVKNVKDILGERA